jgi:hypothetical protein
MFCLCDQRGAARFSDGGRRERLPPTARSTALRTAPILREGSAACSAPIICSTIKSWEATPFALGVDFEIPSFMFAQESPPLYVRLEKD